MLIFANPGCSSTSKPAPAPADTVAPAPAAPIVSVPLPNSAAAASDGGSSLSAAPISFDPSAPAVAGVRFTPTRPGTPAATALEAAPVADVVPAAAYVVKSGDNLWNLAKKNHLSVSELAGANNLKAGTALRPGQKLIIPGKAPAAGSTAAPATAKVTPTATPTGTAAPKPAGDSTTHTVKMGESLGTIARKYGVRQGDVAVANNITDPQKITAGQILVIPAAAKSKTATPATKTVDMGKPAEPAKPLFVVPPIEQDLDAGLKAAPAGEVPVIKIEESPAPKKF
jgi:LysM repeat protein